jgi:hypothetical protein
MNQLKELVINYPSKYKEGLLQSELHEILKYFPEIYTEKFEDAISNITVTLIDNNIVIYKHDIYKALLFSI